MNVDDIRTLYAYSQWATSRLLDAARALSASDVARDLAASHGSVRGTLVHILWGEWIWLQRWRGHSPKRVFAEDEFPNVDAIATTWSEVERDRREFIATLSASRLLTRVAYENLQGQRWEYPLGQMMQHVANHSSYHRGQVVTLLRQLGQSPPPTDFLMFFDEVGGQA